MASAFLIAIRSGRITWAKMQEDLADYSGLSITLPEDPDTLLIHGARILLDVPIGYYDGVYLALADQVGGSFVTADDKFYRKAGHLFPSVTWIGDIPA